jgi:hypothetical protein
MSVQQHAPAVGESLAIFRWKRGHHVFHIQLTAINTLAEEGLRALETGDDSVLLRCLERLTVLYDAATASMRYAADFPRDVYENVVRPGMMPPFVNQGFSGSLNADHSTMQKSLTHLGRELYGRFGTDRGKWPVAVAEAWGAVQGARLNNRRHHGLICRRFVDDGMSLLQQYYEGRDRKCEHAEALHAATLHPNTETGDIGEVG